MLLFPPNGRALRFWSLNVVMLGILATFIFLYNLLHLDLGAATGYTLFQVALCLGFIGVLMPVYRWLERRVGFGVQTAVWIVGLSLVATLVQSAAAIVFGGSLNWHRHPFLTPLDLWLLRILFFWLGYVAWSLLFFWLRAERNAQAEALRRAEAEIEAQRMELHFLRSQLDPHFLFNALNGVATVVEPSSPPSAAVVRELADYLRYSLKHRHDTMVSLAEEIEAIMAYLRIEQTRFDEELHIEITTDDRARIRQVPCFILLPLVENAVKHSFQRDEPPWAVSILAETREDWLHIEVRNSGALENSPKSSSGAGLDILRRRLALHYPQRHRFELTGQNGSVKAQLELEGNPCCV